MLIKSPLGSAEPLFLNEKYLKRCTVPFSLNKRGEIESKNQGSVECKIEFIVSTIGMNGDEESTRHLGYNITF